MYHETHIFMFGLKNKKLILLIHVVVLFIYKQTDKQTDRWIDLLQIYLLRLVQSFNYLHASAFCAPTVVYGDRSKIKMISLISYLRAR